MDMAITDPPIYIPEGNVIIIVLAIMALFVAATIFVMIKDYSLYLENHWMKKFNFADFIKQEQFYIYLLLFFFLMVCIECCH